MPLTANNNGVTTTATAATIPTTTPTPNIQPAAAIAPSTITMPSASSQTPQTTHTFAMTAAPSVATAAVAGTIASHSQPFVPTMPAFNIQPQSTQQSTQPITANIGAAPLPAATTTTAAMPLSFAPIGVSSAVGVPPSTQPPLAFSLHAKMLGFAPLPVANTSAPMTITQAQPLTFAPMQLQPTQMQTGETRDAKKRIDANFSF